MKYFVILDTRAINALRFGCLNSTDQYHFGINQIIYLIMTSCNNLSCSSWTKMSAVIIQTDFLGRKNYLFSMHTDYLISVWIQYLYVKYDSTDFHKIGSVVEPLGENWGLLKMVLFLIKTFLKTKSRLFWNLGTKGACGLSLVSFSQFLFNTQTTRKNFELQASKYLEASYVTQRAYNIWHQLKGSVSHETPPDLLSREANRGKYWFRFWSWL